MLPYRHATILFLLLEKIKWKCDSEISYQSGSLSYRGRVQLGCACLFRFFFFFFLKNPEAESYNILLYSLYSKWTLFATFMSWKIVILWFREDTMLKYSLRVIIFRYYQIWIIPKKCVWSAHSFEAGVWAFF